jgi:hypothetical protein
MYAPLPPYKIRASSQLLLTLLVGVLSVVNRPPHQVPLRKTTGRLRDRRWKASIRQPKLKAPRTLHGPKSGGDRTAKQDRNGRSLCGKSQAVAILSQ